jgi:hypothetical protein
VKNSWGFSASSYLSIREKHPTFEIVNVMVSVSHSPDDLYPVILPLDKAISYTVVKMIIIPEKLRFSGSPEFTHWHSGVPRKSTQKNLRFCGM